MARRCRLVRGSLAGVTKRIWVLAVVGLSAALLASCTSSGEGPPPVNSGLPTATPLSDPPALEEYLGILGYYAGDIEVIQHRPAPSESEYRQLVASYRERGMEGLSTEDRELLLAVGQVAFEAYPDTLRYSVTAEETRAGSDEARGGEAVLEEVYRHPPAAPPLAARRVQGRAIIWGWPSDPRWYPDAPSERLEFLEFFVADQPSESLFATWTEWDKRDDGWTCIKETGEATPVFALMEGIRLGSLQDYVLGDLLGPDKVDGGAAYKLYSLNRTTGREITYWLDAETLWLRQYEYERDGIRYTVKLEAVNEDIRIEPPDVNVPCEEQ